MVGPPWIAVLGSGPRVDADNRSHTNPLTGKPDAGDPPVRFGGRGSGKPLSLPLSLSCARIRVGDGSFDRCRCGFCPTKAPPHHQVLNAGIEELKPSRTKLD